MASRPGERKSVRVLAIFESALALVLIAALITLAIIAQQVVSGLLQVLTLVS